MKRGTRLWALRIIVNVMCNRGFMNGWFGDVSEEFRDCQVGMLDEYTYEQRKQWLDSNLFNLVHYCRVPASVIMTAAR